MADKRRRPRSAMVTGAAQGIGRAIALQLATDGFDVTVADLPALRSLAEDTATSIRALGRKAHVSLADISDRGEAERMCAEHLDALDPIWCMVANAGIAQVKPVMELTEQDVRKTFDVNVFGMFNCFQVAAKHMIEQGGGGRLLAASRYLLHAHSHPPLSLADRDIATASPATKPTPAWSTTAPANSPSAASARAWPRSWLPTVSSSTRTAPGSSTRLCRMLLTRGMARARGGRRAIQ